MGLTALPHIHNPVLETRSLQALPLGGKGGVFCARVKHQFALFVLVYILGVYMIRVEVYALNIQNGDVHANPATNHRGPD